MSQITRLNIFHCSMLQVEHRTTEQLAEQIEKRVSSESNSLDNVSISSQPLAKTIPEEIDLNLMKRFSGGALENHEERDVSGICDLALLSLFGFHHYNPF